MTTGALSGGRRAAEGVPRGCRHVLGAAGCGKWDARPGPVPGKPAAGSGRQAGSHRRNSGPHPHPAWGWGWGWGGPGGRARWGGASGPAPPRVPAPNAGHPAVRSNLPGLRAGPSGESGRPGGAAAGEQSLGEVGSRPSRSASAPRPGRSLPIPSLSSAGRTRTPARGVGAPGNACGAATARTLLGHARRARGRRLLTGRALASRPGRAGFGPRRRHPEGRAL